MTVARFGGNRIRLTDPLFGNTQKIRRPAALTPRNEAARVRILLLALTIASTTLGCSRAGAPTVGSNANANAGAKPSAPPATSSSDPGAPMRITFSTDDDAGVQIAGDLYVPDKTPA